MWLDLLIFMVIAFLIMPILGILAYWYVLYLVYIVSLL